MHGGFLTSAIEHVDANSKLQDKKTIINVLNGVMIALNAITDWTSKDEHLTPELPMSVHELIMAPNKTSIHSDNTTKIHYRVLVPTGAWRRKTVFAPRANNSIITFHPFGEVPKSMHLFADIAKPIIDAIEKTQAAADPYTVAAWLHHVLISIHPFEDGNGRMTRLISSIPLVLVGLPPICISVKNKSSYIKALNVADTNLDLGPLARVFATESLVAIDRVKRVGNITSSMECDDFAHTQSVPLASLIEADT